MLAIGSTNHLPTQPAPKVARGKIIKSRGVVQTKKIKSNKWVKCKVGDSLEENMELRTGLRSSCLVRLQNSVIVQIRSATRITIAELKKYAKTERTRIVVKYGIIRAGVVPKGGIISDFQIACPTAILSREGTWGIEFLYDPATGNYRVGLDTEGLIRVVNTRTGKSRRIYPGEFTTQEMEMWVNNATFRNTVFLTDPFGTTQIEKLLYANNSGGRSGFDPTGLGFAGMMNPGYHPTSCPYDYSGEYGGGSLQYGK